MTTLRIKINLTLKSVKKKKTHCIYWEAFYTFSFKACCFVADTSAPEKAIYIWALHWVDERWLAHPAGAEYFYLDSTYVIVSGHELFDKYFTVLFLLRVKKINR